MSANIIPNRKSCKQFTCVYKDTKTESECLAKATLAIDKWMKDNFFFEVERKVKELTPSRCVVMMLMFEVPLEHLAPETVHGF